MNLLGRDFVLLDSSNLPLTDALERRLRQSAQEPEPLEKSGLPNAALRLAKAELARVVRTIVKERGWTQRKAAVRLGIAPPDMSDLVRGKLVRFSQERLERFLNRLDMDVCILVRPRPTTKARADITVEVLRA